MFSTIKGYLKISIIAMIFCVRQGYKYFYLITKYQQYLFHHFFNRKFKNQKNLNNKCICNINLEIMFIVYSYILL